MAYRPDPSVPDEPTTGVGMPRAAARGRRVGRVTSGISGIFDGPAVGAIARRDRVFRRLLMVADATAALVAVALAVNVLGDDELRLTALLTAPLVVLASKVIGLYDRDELVLRKSTLDESPQLFQLAAIYALLATVLQGRFVDGALSTQQVLGIWVLLFAGAFVCRVGARAVAAMVTPPERCLVIGDLGLAQAVGAKLDDANARRQTLAARLPMDFDDDRATVLYGVHEAITEHDAHRVILAPQVADSDAVLDVIRLVKSLGVKVSLLPRLFEVVGTSVVFDDLDGVTVLGVRRFGLTRSSAAIKRLMDVGFAGLVLVVLAPVLLAVAVAIRLDSPGPLLFRQIRVGRGGKRFEMLKFRSMVVGADTLQAELKQMAGQDGLFKLTDDPRVTRVGRLLRASSVDELPQFFNVLRGDMSLVGPRPLVVDEDALVRGWHRRRLHLVPGMTGPWQVLGSTRVPLQEMVKIDYLYIANWSLWRDFKILLRTVGHVLRRDGL